MAKPYPKEFRDDVVAVARQGQASLSQIAKDFGISEGSLANWMKQADIEDGKRSGLTDDERKQLRPRARAAVRYACRHPETGEKPRFSGPGQGSQTLYGGAPAGISTRPPSSPSAVDSATCGSC